MIGKSNMRGTFWLMLCAVVALQASVTHTPDNVTAYSGASARDVEQGSHGGGLEAGPIDRERSDEDEDDAIEHSQLLKTDELTNEEILQMRIERIKSDILQKLGMREAPNVTRSGWILRNLPSPIIRNHQFAEVDEGLQSDDPAPYMDDYDYEEQEPTRKRTVNIFAEVKFCGSEVDGDCLHFNLGEIRRDEILSAQLWLYITAPQTSATSSHQDRRNNRTIHVYWNKPSTQRKPRWVEVTNQLVNETNSWIDFDVQRIIKSWIGSPVSGRSRGSQSHLSGMRVVCPGGCSVVLPTAERMEHRPFLMIKVRSSQSRRMKRSAMVDSLCRKHPLEINFHNIGWDWIVSPPSYRPNYCHGSCASASGMRPATYSTYREQHNNPAITTCCSAQSTSSITLLYQNTVNDFVGQIVPDMVINSCGCS